MLRLTRLIVWDEITMQHRHAAEAVDRTLRDIRDDDRPFGGIPVVFGGDFQQILPVVRRGQREDIVAASLRRSVLWREIEVLRLKTNMRLQQDGASAEARHFAEWLLDVGCGRSTAEDGTIELPQHMDIGSIEALIHYIYEEVFQPPSSSSHSVPIPPPAYFLNRIILSSRNDDVDDINARVLDEMPGEAKTFFSADTVLDAHGREDPSSPLTPEFLHAIRGSGLPPGELNLKVGCPIIILRNLAPGAGVCNGSRATVIKMSERVLEVRLMGGSHDGESVLIPRITIIPSDSQGEFTFSLRRRQFPVNLAFAMTINKAQGQSVKYVGIDLRSPVFSHGQLYVALSRATSADRVRVVLPDGHSHCTTTNIVYPEILLN